METTLNRSQTTMLIGILCLITSIGRFVVDSFLPSVPAISDAFGVSGREVQLTLTFYMLGFGASQLIYGPLSDRYGRKNILMSGLVLFLISNTAAAMTNSLPLLLVARLAAGLGVGACGVLNRAIANDCFSGSAFSKVWSYTTTTLVLVLMLAPLLGGVVQEHFDWRVNLLLSTLFVILALGVIAWKLPETHHSARLTVLNIRDIVKNYHTILSYRSFIACTLCYTLAFGGLIAYFQVSPLILIKIMQLSPTQYGLASLVIAGSYLAGGLVVNRCAHTAGTKRLLVWGMIFITFSGLCMLLWDYDTNVSLTRLLLPTAIYVVGARIVIPNAIAGAFTGLRNMGGSVSGLMGGIQMLGSALISALIASFSFESTTPLALMFIGIGLVSLIIFCYDCFRSKRTYCLP